MFKTAIFDENEVRKFHTIIYIQKLRDKLKSLLSGYDIVFETNYSMEKHIKDNKISKIRISYEPVV